MASPAVSARAEGKVYDKAYFDKWYHNSRTRVHTPEAVRRKVRMVVGVAEYFLRHPVRSVLDIGAGEGAWRKELLRFRRGVRYVGVDPSEYVVQRYGVRRNIRLGSFQDLPTLSLGRGFDLVVCADVLQYVDDGSLKRGVGHIVKLLNGVTFLESYTTADDMEGDLADWHPRSKSRYRQIFADSGLYPCGLHCYLTKKLADRSVELELV